LVIGDWKMANEQSFFVNKRIIYMGFPGCVAAESPITNHQ